MRNVRPFWRTLVFALLGNVLLVKHTFHSAKKLRKLKLIFNNFVLGGC